MTITTVIAALQSINAAVTDVDNAPTDYPSKIESADLPMVITWPGPAETTKPSGKESQRTYQMTVYIKPHNQGRGIAEGWNEAKTMMQSLIDAYADVDNVLLVNDGTYQASIRSDAAAPITDGGFELLAYPPSLTGADVEHYFAIQYRVVVKETWA